MIHLHTHSMYSLRDSIIKPDELADKLSLLGQNAVAITEHGNSLGGVSIYKILKKHNIKYIHGVEFYICNDVSVKDKTNKYYHLIALCKNDVGRLNLNRLITLSEHPDNKYYKPRIDFNILKQYSEGLIILSACLAGEVSRALLSGNTLLAEQIALKYKNVFGEDYYLEIQSRMEQDQIEINKQIISLAKKLNIEFVVTCDAHYLNKEDSIYQNKYAFNGAYKEDGESYVDCYVQSEDEVRTKLSYLPKSDVDRAINNTEYIASQCSVDMPLSAPIMPKIKVPSIYQDSRQWLIELCKQGFKDKLNIDIENKCVFNSDRQPIFSDSDIKTYINRFEYELDALTRMGFVDYILLVYSYANKGKRRGIARGSGGGSLINYVTNITDIDPVEHKLYFERFIDVGALELLDNGEITKKELKVPDIDLDFSKESCEEVLKFLYDTYGETRVASIGKFGTNKTKGTIRDMCKVLNISLAEADKIAKSFGDFEIEQIDAMIKEEIPTSSSAKDAINYVKQYPELFDYVRKLNGLPKSFGLHACGRIVATADLDTYLPSCYDKDGIRFLQGDMHDVEDVGLVKIDLLGLRTLDQEYDTLEMSGETKEFLNPKQDFSDPKVLDIFRNGDTVGIFQMSSYGMKDVLKKMEVSGIGDLSVANALYRPGSLKYIENYCNRKKGVEQFEYLHPDLEPILKETFGIIVYQEQLIDIGRLAGMRNPDLLRKATAKKNTQLLAQIKPELQEKLYKRGWSEKQFEKLWADMIDFAFYSFNKSHAAAYAIIAYMTAKQKAYYPAEFYAGLCNSYIGHSDFVKDSANEIVSDMRSHQVKIAPFSFRQDHRKCSVDEQKRILWGVPLIKGLNSATGDVLYRFKDSHEIYLWSLFQKMIGAGITKASLKTLILLGFFDEYGSVMQCSRVLEVADNFKYGNHSSLNSEEVPDELKNQSNILTNRNSKGVELKKYKIVDGVALLNWFESNIRKEERRPLDYKTQIQNQKELLGFVNLITLKVEDKPKLFVKEVYELKRKKDGKQFGYSIVTQSIGSGKESRFTVLNSLYKKEPIIKEDIILCKGYTRDGKYFTMTDYEHIYC